MGTYYKNIEQYLDRIDHGSWIEIGVDRGEGSTKFFSDLSQHHATKFFAVDADLDQVMRARYSLSLTGNATVNPDGTVTQDVGEPPSHVTFIHGRGEVFIDKLQEQDPGGKVSLVYLDNFDWDYWVGRQEESFVPAQKEHYKKTMGVEMTNINSQQAHLLQAIKLMPWMTDNSIIVCDDTWYHPQEGVFIGKCSAVIPFLLLNGYKVLHTDGYRQNSGVILGKFKTVDKTD
jgi:hypothetical protein